jgi:hypothetical protein
MRQTIKGLLAAFAVMTAGAAPAMACGYNPCGTSYAPVYAAPVYAAPTYSYSYSSGCGSCGNVGYAAGGWGYEALAEPTTQYYYVNQGPTYSGPGSFAPAPAYQEEALPTYGYGYRHHYRPYYHSYHYGYAPRHYGYRYGYAPRHYAYRHWGHEGYYYGRPLVRRYY